MRLKNIYYLCKKQLPLIKAISFEEYEVGSGANKSTKYRCKVWRKHLQNINNMAAIESLNTDIDYFGKFRDFLDNNKNLVFDINEYTQFKNELNKLILKIQTIIDLCESMGYSQEENGFDVKLPDGIDFTDFTECVKDINTAFKQNPYLNQDGDKIEFKALDIGSSWLTFTAICTGIDLILNRLAMIIDKAFTIRSHKIMCDQQIQQLKSAQAKNEFLDSITSTFKEATNLLLEKAAKELASEISPLEPDGEERLKHSLDLLSDWMAKGMEIYSSIDAPKEIQMLFPPVEKQKLSKVEIGLLSEQTLSEDE